MFKDGRVIVCIVAWIATAVAASVIVNATKEVSCFIFLGPTIATISLLGGFGDSFMKEEGDENE